MQAKLIVFMDIKLSIMKPFLSFVAVAMLLVSCGKSEDLHDPTWRENSQKQSYADNFVKAYGEHPDQTWDFTTNDFDFNDVVVDVIENIKIGRKITMENGVVVKDEETGTVAASQRAIIRALGGTLDLTLKIGNTEWKKSSKLEAAKMYNTEKSIDYDAVLDEFPVYGWSPTNNNVSIVVNQQNSTEVYNITFPKKGTAPMIIAVEPEVKWMNEP